MRLCATFLGCLLFQPKQNVMTVEAYEAALQAKREQSS